MGQSPANDGQLSDEAKTEVEKDLAVEEKKSEQGIPSDDVKNEDSESLTEEERELLIEYATWFDDPGGSASDFVDEFEAQR